MSNDLKLIKLELRRILTLLCFEFSLCTLALVIIVSIDLLRSNWRALLLSLVVLLFVLVLVELLSKRVLDKSEISKLLVDSETFAYLTVSFLELALGFSEYFKDFKENLLLSKFPCCH